MGDGHDISQGKADFEMRPEHIRYRRRLFVDRGDGGHLVTVVPHLVLCQNVFVVAGGRDTVHRIGDVLAGDHREHAGQGLGLGSVDSFDDPVGDRRAEDLAVNHVGQGDVGGIDRPARNLVGGIDAGDRNGDVIKTWIPGYGIFFPSRGLQPARMYGLFFLSRGL